MASFDFSTCPPSSGIELPSGSFIPFRSNRFLVETAFKVGRKQARKVDLDSMSAVIYLVYDPESSRLERRVAGEFPFKGFASARIISKIINLGFNNGP